MVDRDSDNDRQRMVLVSDATPVHSLPPELLGDLFAHLSVPRLDSMEDVVRASLVCRFWRQVALTTPRLWINIHAVLDRIEPVIVGSFCDRSAPLPLSIRFDCEGYQTRIDAAIFSVLTANAARIREFIGPGVSCRLLNAPGSRSFLALPFPQLQTLWIMHPKALPPSFLAGCAHTLTTLCLPPSVVPPAGDYPSLRRVTTFRFAYGLPTLQEVERVLTLCPNLQNLIDAATCREPFPTPPRCTVRLQTLCFVDSQLKPSFPAPLLEMLNHSRITHITVLGTYMDSMALVVGPLDTIVHATFNWSEGYIDLSDTRGYVRCFHGCDFRDGEPFRRLCALPALTWSLTSLTVMGAIPPEFPFPPLDGLVSLTIGLPRFDDAAPSAFARDWPCPWLSVLQLSSRREKGALALREILNLDVQLFVDFVSARLAVSRLAELRLNSVRLWPAPGVEGRQLARCERLVHTSDVLEPKYYGADIPYALDRPWEYQA